MFKNVKTKIILISLIIGIITVSILGGIYLKTTQNLLEFAKQDNNFSDINNNRLFFLQKDSESQHPRHLYCDKPMWHSKISGYFFH